MSGLALMLTAVLAAGFPPLADSQQRQLAAAVDGSRAWDRGPLYPLLDNAMRWQPGQLAGATVPDYAALRQNPGQHRGAVFLIEGDFVRRRRLPLSRSGPWGDAVTEWAIRIGEEPDARYVIVFFADPDQTLPHPTRGTAVRVAGRFYKLWASKTKVGQRKTWLTFVARSADVTGGGRAWPTLDAGMLAAAALAGLAVLVFGLLLRQARRLRQRPAAPSRLGRSGEVPRHRAASPSDEA
jgi:hypothetical protein